MHQDEAAKPVPLSPRGDLDQHSQGFRSVCVGAIFFLSGAAGLIYEVTWFRILANTFGATGPAIAVTTAAFMAGLGLGSLWGGRLVDRSRNPIFLYAMLEAGIATIAIFMRQGISLVENIQSQLSITIETTIFDHALLFAGVFLLLVIPTALMGATLPTLVKATVRSQSQLGSRFAWLYTSNTFGAVCGTFATGFFLIPKFGVEATTLSAVGLNVVAAIAAWLITRLQGQHRESVAAQPDLQITTEIDPCQRNSTLIYFAVFFSGFVALACQYQWTRALIFAFDRLKNTTYSFSAVLTVTLIGIVAGAAIIYFIVDRLKNPYATFGIVTLGIGVSIVASFATLVWMPPLIDAVNPQTLRVNFPKAVSAVFVRSFIVMGVPTVLMGVALPLAARLVTTQNRVGISVGRLYACNTWGAVSGAILGAYLITPLFGIVKGILLLGIMEIVVAICLLWRSTTGATLLAPVFLGGATLWCFLQPDHISLSSLLPNEKVIRYRDGPMASVSVIENERGERRISVDDVPVAGTSTIMQTDQKSLAHWSMMLAKNPRRALTVGFGSGGASHSFLLHDQLEHLDCVEICRDVPQFADLLTDANHGLLENPDPRYQIIFADARAYLRRTPHRYDAIVSDCTDLRYRSSANLYDLEYFQLCYDKLTDGGCTVIWMPLGGLSADAFRMTLRTFCAVFPDAGVFYLHNRWTHYVLFVGHRNAPEISIDSIRRILTEDDVRMDLQEIGMTNPYKIAATFLTHSPQMQPLLLGDKLNTENHPLLEFEVPKFDTGPWSAQRNLNLLRRYEASIEPWLADSVTVEERVEIRRFQKAASLILAAQEAEQDIDIEQATQLYLDAQKLTPDDPAIATALTFPALRNVAEEGQPTAWLLLGRSQQIQGNLQAALENFDQYDFHMNRLSTSFKREDEQLLMQAKAWQSQANQWRADAVANLPGENLAP